MFHLSTVLHVGCEIYEVIQEPRLSGSERKSLKTKSLVIGRKRRPQSSWHLCRTSWECLRPLLSYINYELLLVFLWMLSFASLQLQVQKYLYHHFSFWIKGNVVMTPYGCIWILFPFPDGFKMIWWWCMSNMLEIVLTVTTTHWMWTNI